MTQEEHYWLVVWPQTMRPRRVDESSGTVCETWSHPKPAGAPNRHARRKAMVTKRHGRGRAC